LNFTTLSRPFYRCFSLGLFFARCLFILWFIVGSGVGFGLSPALFVGVADLGSGDVVDSEEIGECGLPFVY
jgi:hypothetical protein